MATRFREFKVDEGVTVDIRYPVLAGEREKDSSAPRQSQEMAQLLAKCYVGGR